MDPPLFNFLSNFDLISIDPFCPSLPLHIAFWISDFNLTSVLTSNELNFNLAAKFNQLKASDFFFCCFDNNQDFSETTLNNNNNIKRNSFLRPAKFCSKKAKASYFRDLCFQKDILSHFERKLKQLKGERSVYK